MTELKSMTDKELAQRMVNYIEELEKLMKVVSEFNNSKASIEQYSIENIRYRYRQLKEQIRSDSHYTDLCCNAKRDNCLYSTFFAPSIQESAAFGFASPTNGKINNKFYSSIEEAHYRLIKHYGLKKWIELAQS